jgi:phospholipid/cholesterol/gamma-HCH transport system permease protein
MAAAASESGVLAALGRAAAHWLAGWWRLIQLGTLLLAMALARSSYDGEGRRALARQVALGTGPALVGFTVLSALISLVLIRIVIVTAVSYGLSQYALEMVVRVLVLELIPLTAALFAALRVTIPAAAEIGQLRDAPDLLRREVLPRVTGGLFCALMLAAVSCVVALVVAYLLVYGFTGAGFPAYTRTVGKVFGPGLSLIFGLKILFFGLAVALVPAAAVLDAPRSGMRTSAELRGLVRMFLMLLLIEAASLIGNYY